MAPLSSDLQAVIDALPPSTPHNLSSHYRQAILNNADALDAVEQCTASAPPTDRAAMACKARGILFGDRTVTPQGSLYKEEQQENWSVTPPLTVGTYPPLVDDD